MLLLLPSNWKKHLGIVTMNHLYLRIIIIIIIIITIIVVFVIINIIVITNIFITIVIIVNIITIIIIFSFISSPQSHSLKISKGSFKPYL